MFKDVEIRRDENAVYKVLVSAKALEKILKMDCFESNADGVIVTKE